MLSVSDINKILNMNLKHDKYTNRIYYEVSEFYRDNEFLERNNIIICLIYINRYKSKKEITEKNIKNLIETCLILSSKFISDCEIIGRGPMETEFLENINWDLFVDEEEYKLFSDLFYSI